VPDERSIFVKNGKCPPFLMTWSAKVVWLGWYRWLYLAYYSWGNVSVSFKDGRSMSNASEVRRADQSMSHDATLESLQEGYSPRSTAVVHGHAKNRPRPLWVLVVRKHSQGHGRLY
jgi:hypothetical protein